jgi:hypothetical protein
MEVLSQRFRMNEGMPVSTSSQAVELPSVYDRICEGYLVLLE